jgi:D-alanyl-D-alanine dipeptidase
VRGDPDSRRYNAILDEATAGPPDWVGPDRMLRPDGLYKKRSVRGPQHGPRGPRGRVVHLHSFLARARFAHGRVHGHGTGRVVELLRVLDAAKAPVMVQVPRTMFERLAPAWGLPDMPVDGS